MTTTTTASPFVTAMQKQWTRKRGEEVDWWSRGEIFDKFRSTRDGRGGIGTLEIVHCPAAVSYTTLSTEGRREYLLFLDSAGAKNRDNKWVFVAARFRLATGITIKFVFLSPRSDIKPVPPLSPTPLVIESTATVIVLVSLHTECS